MNKRDLAKSVAVHSDVHLSIVQKVLDGFTDVVTAVVARGEPVVMTGFAKFTKVERAARMGRNPATGEQIRIKASKRVRIAPAKAFKDVALSPTSAPKLARGTWPLSAEAVKVAGQNVGATPQAPKAPLATKRPAVKKAAVKKAPVKKATAKRPAVKKVAVKKVAVKKAAVKKAAVKKAVGARATPTARKTATKRAGTRTTAR